MGGIDALEKLLQRVSAKRIFLLFFANEIDGKSWCPDCVAAKPIIERNLKYLHPNNDTFVTVYVGEKAEWKNKKNIFRTDERFKVTGVPTLLQFGTDKRLVESQCEDDHMLQTMFG